MSDTKTAAIIVIGNEILSAKVADENGIYLARELRELGVSVQRMVVIPDDETAIGDEVRWCAGRFHWVFTTGGVGPTHDDVTMAGIARGLGRRVLPSPEIEAMLRRYLGAALNAAALKIAWVPEGAGLIVEPGLTFPVVAVENIFIFPGVPAAVRRKFTAIKHRFQDRPFHLRKIHVREREEQIAQTLNAVLANFPKLMLGSYPVGFSPDEHVILTLESKDPAYLGAAFDLLLVSLPPDRVLKVE